MLFLAAIAICLNSTPVSECQESTAVDWITISEPSTGLSGCMRDGMMSAARSRTPEGRRLSEGLLSADCRVDRRRPEQQWPRSFHSNGPGCAQCCSAARWCPRARRHPAGEELRSSQGWCPARTDGISDIAGWTAAGLTLPTRRCARWCRGWLRRFPPMSASSSTARPEACARPHAPQPAPAAEPQVGSGTGSRAHLAAIPAARSRAATSTKRTSRVRSTSGAPGRPVCRSRCRIARRAFSWGNLIQGE